MPSFMLVRQGILDELKRSDTQTVRQEHTHTHTERERERIALYSIYYLPVSLGRIHISNVEIDNTGLVGQAGCTQ